MGMNLTEVKKGLDKLFAAVPKQGAVRNIVFWYDDNGVFANEVDNIGLDSAKTIKLYDNNQFEVKIYIERKDTENHLLVYSPAPRPADKDNWFADTIRYSKLFATDEASLILVNYKMNPELLPIAREYAAFFRHAERVRRFENYGINEWINADTETADKFDMAILSALCKLSVPNFDACIRVILSEVIAGDSGSQSENPSAVRQCDLIDAISKFGSMNRLWALIRRYYDYPFEERSFQRLAVMFLVTHFAHSVAMPLPKSWEVYNTHSTSCSVFVDVFMKDVSTAKNYKEVCGFAAKQLNLETHIAKWDINTVSPSDTFPQIDEAIITRIRGNILSGAGEFGDYKKMIDGRRKHRWFCDYEKEYEALYYACELFESLNAVTTFAAASVKALWNAYKDKYYRFDYFYRKFVTAYDGIEQANNGEEAPSPFAHASWQDDWMKLTENVENAYANGFLSELAVKWCDLLDSGKDADGFIPWDVPDADTQARFFNRKVSPYIHRDERVVVVISDALRYESAVELTQILNREFKCKCTLSEMLGVIPSYTALGMAALLPHKNVEISAGGDIVVDGINSKGTNNREIILKKTKAESAAITYEKLMRLSKQQLSETFNGIKLIYVYHNAIDARGDNASTEREVFEATEKAFSELVSVVRRLTSGISAINILLTVDHGYIYRRTTLQASDKTPKGSGDTIETNRRFVLTKASADSTDVQGTQKFSMSHLGQRDITAVIPRGVNIFPVQGGGANYVHGGSSLQEVMIPLITFKSGKNIAKVTAPRKVTLSLSSLSRKITSVITHLEFFQNEPVGEKLLPLRVKVFFADEAGNKISNENIIIADSASKEPTGRAYREKFTLRNTPYDKKQTYYLVMQDDDDMVGNEIARFTYTIDLMFGGGIQF